MSIFDKLFGIAKKDKIKDVTNLQEVTQENQEKIIGLLNVREKCTSEMFSSIEQYTTIRDSLIKKSITQYNNISKEEGIAIINDFIENIVDQLPPGVLVPIKTSFVYRGKAQVLYVGKNMLLAGKSLRANATRPRHSLSERQTVGFFLDFDEELNLFDMNHNSKVFLSKERRPKIINLAREQLIEVKTVNCRIANLELIFNNWEESLESIIKLDEIDLINELLEHLVSLDYEITTGVTDFFNRKAKEEELELQKQKEDQKDCDTNDVSTQNSHSSTESEFGTEGYSGSGDE